MDVKNLEPYAIIGFDGSAVKGLKVHPDGEHIVYPMGNKVCIQEWKSKKMFFLSGHTNSVSTVAVSPKGTYVGSGQINHIGFKAAAKIWDFKRRVVIGSHELHKVRVEALAFSSDERYMISLGGRDDGCVVLWDCAGGAASATAAASRLTTGDAFTLAPLNLRFNSFVTGGDSNLRVWNVRAESKNLDVVDVALGKLRRSVRCITVNKDDSYGYAGTTTGDMIKFSINYPADPSASVAQCKPSLIGCLAKCGPWRKGKRPESICYSQGIESILIMDDGCLIVGAGDGTVDLLDEINWKGDFPKGKILDPNKPHFKAVSIIPILPSGNNRPRIVRTVRMAFAGTNVSLSQPDITQKLTERIDDLKQRIAAWGKRIRRYTERSTRFNQNRLFQSDQKRLYESLERPMVSGTGPAPNQADTVAFWRGLWSEPVNHSEGPWTEVVASQCAGITPMDPVIITPDDVAEAVRRAPNWKSPGLDGLHHYWLKGFMVCHSVLARQFQEALNQKSLPTLLFTTGITHLVPKDQGTTDPSKYRPITWRWSWNQGTTPH
ncbi:unnamed protein product [Parnassius apollo]|uniref:(apollo) hypothetical protein n=1 Tax=Parnassius apollo TaxID=110799 RepID=A0A8S3WB18_PARAO|nr:unnamed protein product [Parnassius apollo]